jgi:hypothetical protein
MVPAILLLAMLPKKDFLAAVRNAKMQGCERLLYEENNTIQEAVSGVMLWGSTPEGHEYWQGVYEHAKD